MRVPLPDKESLVPPASQAYTHLPISPLACDPEERNAFHTGEYPGTHNHTGTYKMIIRKNLITMDEILVKRTPVNRDMRLAILRKIKAFHT